MLRPSKIIGTLFSSVAVLFLVNPQPLSQHAAAQEADPVGDAPLEWSAIVGHKQNGVVYISSGSNSVERFSARQADRALANLVDTGANWLALVTNWYQTSHTSTSIHPTSSTDLDADLAHVVRQAHQRGLKVMMRPSVALLDYPSHWHGEIGTGFTSEQEWDAWFTSYAAFINHYAELAQLTGADQLSLGNELGGTTQREDDWRWVVTGVRARYAGPLVYGANWGSEDEPGWWNAIDFIGISAYYPLASRSNPSLDQLRAAWSPLVDHLADLSARWGKPILFTEIGYSSLAGASRAPANCCSEGGTLALDEQANAYQAAFESLYSEPWFAGLFWWAWDTNPLAGGPCDGGFTPHDKPAEDVVRAWYGGATRSRSSPVIQGPVDYRGAVPIYADELGPGWVDASWSAVRDLRATASVHSGTRAISANLAGFGALAFLREQPDPVLNPSSRYLLEFYLYGAPQVLWGWLTDRQGTPSTKVRVDACNNAPATWALVRLELDNPSPHGGAPDKVVLQNGSGYRSSTFLIDDVRIVPLAS